MCDSVCVCQCVREQCVRVNVLRPACMYCMCVRERQCVCVQCPAATATGHRRYGVVSGQHRLCGLIKNMQTDAKFHTKLREGMKPAKSNDEIEVPYFVLRSDCHSFVLQYLLHQVNTALRMTTTGSGVWEFIPQYRSVKCVDVTIVWLGWSGLRLGRLGDLCLRLGRLGLRLGRWSVRMSAFACMCADGCTSA